MQAFNAAMDLLLSTIFAFIIALAGGLVRLFHERVHGEPFSWSRVFLVLVSAVLLGVVGQTVGEYLHTNYNLPLITGGALGGLLGYLGPTFLDTLAAIALRKVEKSEKLDEDDKKRK